MLYFQNDFYNIILNWIHLAQNRVKLYCEHFEFHTSREYLYQLTKLLRYQYGTCYKTDGYCHSWKRAKISVQIRNSFCSALHVQVTGF